MHLNIRDKSWQLLYFISNGQDARRMARGAEESSKYSGSSGVQREMGPALRIIVEGASWRMRGTITLQAAAEINCSFSIDSTCLDYYT